MCVFEIITICKVQTTYVWYQTSGIFYYKVAFAAARHVCRRRQTLELTIFLPKYVTRHTHTNVCVQHIIIHTIECTHTRAGRSRFMMTIRQTAFD